MKLEALMNFTIDIGDGLDVGEGPYGNRFIGESNGGHFEGGKLKGSIRAAGSADWLTMTEDFAHLDVRATFVTHDDTLIYVEYFGRLELTPAIQAALAGEGDTEFGEACEGAAGVVGVQGREHEVAGECSLDGDFSSFKVRIGT